MSPYSLHFLNDLLEIIRHLGKRIQSDLHRAVRRFGNHRVQFGKPIILLRTILSKLCATAFLPFEGSARDRLRDRQQGFQIKRRVPAWIEFTMPDHTSTVRALPKVFQRSEERRVGKE